MKRLFAVMVLMACESGTSRSATKTPVHLEADQSNTLSDDDVKQQVTALLGNIDTPMPHETWRGLGPRGAALLLATLDDPQALPTRRARAIDGLSAMNWQEATPKLSSLAVTETENRAVRFAAIRAVSALSPDDNQSLLTVVKGAQDARVRALAAEMLSHRAGGCDAVAQQLRAETDETRAFFERAKRQCATN